MSGTPFGRSILILVPHPDDEAVGCAAAIRRAVAGGAEVHCHYLTTGVPSRATLWPWDRARHPDKVAKRRDEARAAAAILGLEPAAFEDRPTRELRLNLDAVRARTAELIGRLDIDMVWTPAYEGGHQDHDAAHAMASTLEVPVWEFAEYNFAGGAVASQAFPFPDGSETVLELTADETALKRRALEAYASEQGNLDYVDSARESFRPFRAADYSRPAHEGTLFYQRFQWVPFRHPRVDFTRPETVCRDLTDWL